MKLYNLITFIVFSFCGLSLNQAAVMPVGFKHVSKKAIVKNDIKDIKVNLNCRYSLLERKPQESLWANHKQLNFAFVAGIKGELKKYNNTIELNKYMPSSVQNGTLSQKDIVERLGLGYLEDVFALKSIKESVENIQPALSTKTSSGTMKFNLNAIKTQATAVYKSSFEAKLVLDFNIKNSELVFSKPISDNTKLSLNLQSTDFERRQTVNLALNW